VENQKVMKSYTRTQLLAGKKKKLGAGWIVLIVLACVGALIGTTMLFIKRNKDDTKNDTK